MRVLLSVWFALSVVVVSAQQKATLKQGLWRGEFVTRYATIPFQFTVHADTAFLINGSERVDLKLQQKGDSVFIPVELYDAVLQAQLSENETNGRFRKLSTEKQDTGIVFTAKYGDTERFVTKTKASSYSLDGKWEVHFLNANDSELTVGLFAQQGIKLTGTIMTKSGDYRYLEGAIDGNHAQLSAFSGSNPYLFDVNFTDNNTFEGTFYTARGKTKIKGIRNEKAELPDPYSFTGLKEGAKKLNFKFPDLNGNIVSINDAKFKDKVVVVSILGSWCPNCVDEAAFLGPWYLKNNKRGVEIIGLAFERKNELSYAKTQLTRLIEKNNIQYSILFAGQTGQTAVANALPELKSFFSFPTIIFIDKKGNVRQIHAGFNGPATGVYYQKFIDDFNREIDTLLSE
jgi:thiol-disulfide isomerase/thioredoxin